MKPYRTWTHRQKVMARKYWQGKSLVEISGLFNLSRQRIHQILKDIGAWVKTQDGYNWKKYYGSDYEYYRHNPIPKSKRVVVFERDGYECVYCGSSGKLTVDHVIPKSHPNTNHELSNLVTACANCNSRKNIKLLNEWKKDEKI